VKCGICLYHGDVLQLNICAFYLWELTLNVRLEASLDNMQDWKGKHEESKGN
jgi:hypothetical protein